VAVPAPSTLTYTVRWTDGVNQGARSVPLQPINDCLPVASTTAETLGVTVVPSPTTVPPPGAEIVTPTTPPFVISSTPAASTAISEETPSSVILPTAIVRDTLPSTGSSPAIPIAVAAGLLLVGGVLIAGRRWPDEA
jgi:LPXTG-motif cell wall-anchored protein